MNVNKKIPLKFECSQDWNAMKATSCGRFCDVCNKEVIDFTGKSKKELNALVTPSSDLCGRFYPEQLDPSLLRPVSLNFHRNAFLFISTIMMTVFTKPLSAQSTGNKTETVIITPPIPTPIPQAPENVEQQETSAVIASHEPFITTKKRRYYWSKSFPFITVRRNHRFTMGCPSF